MSDKILTKSLLLSSVIAENKRRKLKQGFWTVFLKLNAFLPRACTTLILSLELFIWGK
jgi:hypothetical protein